MLLIILNSLTHVYMYISLSDRYKYNNTETELISTLELHLKACRDIEFNDSGTTLFSTGKDLCVMITDLETKKLIRHYENAHEYVYNYYS